MSIDLDSKEQALYDALESKFEELKAAIYGGGGEIPQTAKRDLMLEAAEVAHQLHCKLTESGKEPKHHPYMIKNRGYPPESLEFYQHYHPIEDLLKYIQAPEQFEQPEDQTMNKTFRFEVYTRRWQSSDHYRLTRIPSGWNVRHIAINGPCDKRGEPYLFTVV